MKSSLATRFSDRFCFSTLDLWCHVIFVLSLFCGLLCCVASVFVLLCCFSPLHAASLPHLTLLPFSRPCPHCLHDLSALCDVACMLNLMASQGGDSAQQEEVAMKSINSTIQVKFRIGRRRGGFPKRGLSVAEVLSLWVEWHSDFGA